MKKFKKKNAEIETEELTAKSIWTEYTKEREYKASIGQLGLYEQAKKNERFMLGDQWNGADIGDIPKVVLNVIKQIGDFKVSNIVSNPCTAIYDFDGVPTYLEAQRSPDIASITQTLQNVNQPQLMNDYNNFIAEHNAVASAMTAHFRSVWERCKMDKLNQRGVMKAYISGAYVLYVYFDTKIKTGLYSDTARKNAITGDIAAEILDIANIYFGNPAECDVQRQPWIIISQRKALKQIQREMVKNGNPQAEADGIKADSENDDVGNYNGGDSGKKDYVTLLTRFWKDENGEVWAMQTVNQAIVKKKWKINMSQYPIALFNWDETDNCIYGHSEITELIPNQIAINRMVAFEILSEMTMGMPKIIYNSNAITQEITNDPGQIIEVENGMDVQQAFRYANPAQISPNWNRVQQSLIDNTKSISGATSVALGDVRPENTSAIVALREAANQPLQPKLNRYYSFIEDIARIMGEFVLRSYGKRSLRVEAGGQTYYIPFDADRYKDMILSVRIEVGPSTLWATSTVISTLDNLLQSGKIDIVQFLERIPEGIIPKKQELINDIRAAQQAQLQAQTAEQPTAAQGVNVEQLLATLSPEELAAVEENPALLEQVLMNNTQ